MENWPDPPKTAGEQSEGTDRGTADRQLFEQLVRSNLDLALEQLPEWEQGRVDPGLRRRLLNALDNAGRTQESEDLALQLLGDMQGLQDATAVSGLRTLLHYFARSGPQVLDEHLPRWRRR